GEFTELLASKTKEWAATDFSKQMVDNAAKRLNIETVTYRVEDATALSFDDNSFDAVIIANTLHVMPNPATALKEIHRVLKDDGLLFAPTFIFDRTSTKTRVKLLELIGFRVYNKWNEQELREFVERNHFKIIDQSTILATPLSESMIIAQYKNENIL
ncbi:MAG: class I SAM-dependent methyltransferase, partial [Rikenellaceae bacterium]